MSTNTTNTTNTTTVHSGPAAGTTHTHGSSNPIKGAFAKVHGIGEAVRGEVNGAVDSAFNEPTGVAKNDAVAKEGYGEISTGHFGGGTKNREGVVPGDKERRL